MFHGGRQPRLRKIRCRVTWQFSFGLIACRPGGRQAAKRAAVAELALWLAPLPLSPSFVAPAELTGANGRNRSRSGQGLSAQNDLQAIAAWLRGFESSPSTHRAYAKEAQRLLLWCFFERGKAVSDLGADDLLDYFAFLTSPPSSWVSEAPAAKGSPGWRPLRGPLTESSVRQAKAIVNAMLIWMVGNRYLEGNPCALVRTRRASGPKRVERFVRRVDWDFLRAWLERLPEESEKERREKARRRHLLALIYLTAARLSDVSSARMGDVRRRDDGTWWWKVVGKGAKEEDIPVTAELIVSIRAYRGFNGLPPLPSPGEPAPLVLRLAGPEPSNAPLSPNMIYRVVKTMFQSAADDAAASGLHETSAGLRRVSTHWLRHTSLTHQLEAGLPLTVVRDNARHASIATTSKYLWTEDRQRHELTSKGLRMGGAETGDEPPGGDDLQ
jgi:integrase/recombinase XerD